MKNSIKKTNKTIEIVAVLTLFVAILASVNIVKAEPSPSVSPTGTEIHGSPKITSPEPSHTEKPTNNPPKPNNDQKPNTSGKNNGLTATPLPSITEFPKNDNPLGAKFEDLVDAKKLTTFKTDKEKIGYLKDKSANEIDRRLNDLKAALDKIKNSPNLTDADKTKLIDAIQKQIDEVTTLKNNLGTSTDLSTVNKEIKQIQNDHKNFGLTVVKANIIASANKIIALTTKLNDAITKLDAKGTELSKSGLDISSLTPILTSLKKNVLDVQTNAKAALDKANSVTDLTVPTAKDTLLEARKSITLAINSVNAARQDIHKYIEQVGKLIAPTPTPITTVVTTTI